MRCSRRSIRSSASALGLTALLAAGGHAAAAPAPVAPDVVVRAMTAAVQARIGRDVLVSIEEMTGVRMTSSAPSLVATPDPQARVGGPVRFVLAEGAGRSRRSRVGEATATVRVSARVVAARRAIARGTRLTREDVGIEDRDLSGRMFRPLPDLDAIVGGRATHDIADGAIVSHADVLAEPVVRSGDLVTARVRMGEVEVTGSGVAVESGARDEIIRVVNQESRAAFRARVIGHGEVEVVDVR